MKPDKKLILLVQDEKSDGSLLHTLLLKVPLYRVVCCSRGDEAFQFMQEIHPDLCIVSYYLPDMTGLELSQRLSACEQISHLPPILLMSAEPPPSEEVYQLASFSRPFSF